MSKSNLKAKNAIKNVFSIIVMYISFIKSFANGTFGTDIVILDSLAPQEIKILLLLMYFWCVCDHYCGIYKQAGFYIQNQCLYEYGCIIPFAMSNTGWIESVHMSLLINNDISRHLVAQKKTNEISTHWFRNNWIITSKINTTGNDNSSSTMRNIIIMSFKWEFYHFYVMEFVNMSYPSTMESCQWSHVDNRFSINISIKTLHGHIFTN
eukprot:166631_1